MRSSNRPSLRAASRFAPTPLALLLRRCLGASLAIAAVGAGAQTAPADRTLSEVTVSGQAEAIGNLQKTYSGGQLARGGSLGLLGTTDLMNVPFSTTNYTSELIRNQQAMSVADVVMNDASVRPLTSRGGFGDDFQVRGFQVSNDDIAINGLFGISPSTRIPLETIERVEVLKGPGALVNGIGPNGNVGGSINVVTKRAADIPLTRLTTTYMGTKQLGLHLDVGRRFGQDNEWGIRANGLVRGGEGNVDGGKQNLALGSLGIDYLGARTRWSLDLIASRGETDEFRPQFTFAGPTVPRPPSGRINAFPGTELRDNVKTVLTRVEHDINDSTTAFASLGYTHYDYQQHFPFTTGGVAPNGDFTVMNGLYDQDTKTRAADAGIRTRFATGSVRHTLALGVNQMVRETGYFYSSTFPVTVPSNIYNPAPLPPAGPRGPIGKSLDFRQSSVAVADTMSFADDRFLLTLGLRHQTIWQRSFFPPAGTPATPDSYDSTATTPLVGAVFKPMKNVSVYANYTAGLTAGQDAPPTATNYPASFGPQRSKQQEVGVKVDWGQLTTQAAIYQIKRPFSDPAAAVFNFGGEQRNRGLELTTYGEIQRGLRVMASASLVDSVLTKTPTGANQGNEAKGVPQHTYNLGLDWDTPWVQGLSVNGRAISTSSVYADEANTQRVGSWTRVDLGARYATRMGNKPVVLRASIENVANKKYWVVSDYVTVGAPRTLMLSAAVDF